MSKKTVDMTNNPIIRTIVLFSLPLMLGNIFQSMYVMVDSIIVGHGLGAYGLSALGTVDWLVWMPMSSLIGLTQGFAIRYAKEYGAKNQEGLNRSVGLSAVLSVLMSIVVVAIMAVCGTAFLRMISTPPEVFADTVKYLNVITAGLPIVCFYNFFSSLLRSIGDSQDPLRAMVIASVVNIILDYLFVIVLHYGVASAALATVLAQAVSMIYCAVIVKKMGIVHPKKEDYRFDLGESLGLLKLGASMSAMNIMIAVGGMIVQTVVNRMGIIILAANTVVNKLYTIYETAAVSFGYAMTTFTAQNLGAKNYSRIKEGYRKVFLLAVGTSLAVSFLLFILRTPLVNLFVTKANADYAEILRAGRYYLTVAAVFMPVLYILHVSRCTLQGLQDATIPMISSIIEFIARLATALILPQLMGNYGIFYAEVSAWVGAMVLLLFFCIKRIYIDRLSS